MASASKHGFIEVTLVRRERFHGQVAQRRHAVVRRRLFALAPSFVVGAVDQSTSHARMNDHDDGVIGKCNGLDTVVHTVDQQGLIIFTEGRCELIHHATCAPDIMMLGPLGDLCQSHPVWLITTRQFCQPEC